MLHCVLDVSGHRRKKIKNILYRLDISAFYQRLIFLSIVSFVK